ncbi:hypothetical protein [Streptomyces sp. NPDC018347]|uniref:hypothetical protein n=1 Tax=Streptomyces sp. NPDC018347 TaxID=3157193 RepID=UPI0033E3051D
MAAGARDVMGYLLRIADTTATVRGRAASPALLLAHLQQPVFPAPHKAPAPAPAAATLDGEDVLPAAERSPWALDAPGQRRLSPSPEGEEIRCAHHRPLSAGRDEHGERTVSALNPVPGRPARCREMVSS